MAVSRSIVIVVTLALAGCASEGDGWPLTTTDVIDGYNEFVSGHCDMDDGRRVYIDDEAIFVEHLAPDQLLLQSYLGCEVGGPVLEATEGSLTASVSSSWADPGCWLLLGPLDAEPFEIRAFSAHGMLVYDRASDGVQIDVVYEGQLGGVPHTVTCTHHGQALRL